MTEIEALLEVVAAINSLMAATSGVGVVIAITGLAIVIAIFSKR